MSPKTEPPDSGYATLSVTHYAIHRERADSVRRRRARPSTKPECLSIGHAWTEDAARHGGQICIVCAAVRFT